MPGSEMRLWFKKILLHVRSRARNVLFQGVAFTPIARTDSGPLHDIYTSSGDLSGFINGLFKFAIAIGAIGAVLRIAYAGYLYMGQADMWSSKGKAKEILSEVTLGLLLLLAIYLILNQINPDILKLNGLEHIQKITPAQQGQ